MPNTGSFLKGVATGAAIGVGVSMILSPVERKDVKKIQKGTGNMFSTVGTVLDSIFSNLQ